MKESKKLKSKHSFLEMGAYQMFAGGWVALSWKKRKRTHEAFPCVLFCAAENRSI